jgi:hypothetical protein
MMVAADAEGVAGRSRADEEVAAFASAIQSSIFSHASERADGSIPKTIADAPTLIRASSKKPLV